ncbi:8-oxo-dGTP diphosphatase MutT [Paraglaciecola aestuariivivens]
MKSVQVAVGVIKQGQQVYISKRADALHQGGKWEFPGGKCEANESIEQALARELNEEVGIQVTEQRFFMHIQHDYGDKQVSLHVQVVEGFSGQPSHQEGQQSLWVDIKDLTDYEFPEANQLIIKKLISQLGQ